MARTTTRNAAKAAGAARRDDRAGKIARAEAQLAEAITSARAAVRAFEDVAGGSPRAIARAARRASLALGCAWTAAERRASLRTQ